MDAANDGAEGIVLLEVLEAGPGLGNGGNVKQGEEDAGDKLEEHEDEGGTAQRVEPGTPDRHGFIQALAQQAPDGGPLIEPVVGGGEAASHQIVSVNRFSM